MSMEVRMILELVQVFTAYTISVFISPYVVFYAYLREKTLAEKFLLCTLIGNFYIINIVFVMFLLHVPSKLSLYLFTLVPSFIGWVQINRPQLKKFLFLLFRSISRLFLGEAKIRTIASLMLVPVWKWFCRTCRAVFRHIIHHIIEWVLFLGLLSFDIWYYGYHVFNRYTYGASDMTVHHYWVHEMTQGTIFCNGVYPFGFHNVIYFINMIFGIKIVSIMNVFAIVQTLYIYAMIYILLRKICRSKYVPILGIFIFTLPNLYSQLATIRYQCSLPQEFGMIFLYPCAYFLMQFFERKKQEIQTEKELQKQQKLYAWMEQYHILPSTRSLIFFGMSFSMTLAAHFYITIIAVFLCLAVAIAYIPIVFQPRYFWSIALAGILSFSSAVAPMGIFYMLGTPLQGSLEWALGVMNDSSSDEDSEEETEDTTEDTEASDTAENDDAASDALSGQNDTGLLLKDASSDSLSSGTPASEAFLDKLENMGAVLLHSLKTYARKLYHKFQAFNETAGIFLCNVCNGLTVTTTLLWLMEGLLAFSLLMILIRRKFYYRNLFSVGVYVFFIVMMCCTIPFNLPSLMDLSRACIFLAYAIPLLGGCVVDAVYIIICRPFRYHRVTEILPLALTVSLIFLTVTNDYVKPLNMVFATQLSGEVICNYKIMETYPDKTWTVVTSTNSLQVVQDNGWHMEVCTFLGKMQHYKSTLRVTIPTKYVFFYIEKTPVNFGYADLVTNPISNSGYISRSGAAQDAVFSGGTAYSVPNRYILESKFYYWAKTFQEKYPQEFQVFYEDDSFLCYRIVQNEYNLYNFAIDYQYNR